MTRNALFVALLVATGISAAAIGQEKSPAKDSKNVTIVIDYGDGVQKHFTAITWKEKFTVLDAMRVAQMHPRGIRIELKGNGDSAFLTKIDDVANEGRGRNWLYRVNGKRGDSSFGVRELAAGDSVLWKFE